MKITTSNELSVDTTRGEQLQIHVRMEQMYPGCTSEQTTGVALTLLPLCSSTSPSLDCRANGLAWT